MKSFDIIIFGARDWSSNWITQHRLAKSLSEKIIEFYLWKTQA